MYSTQLGSSLLTCFAIKLIKNSYFDMCNDATAGSDSASVFVLLGQAIVIVA